MMGGRTVVQQSAQLEVGFQLWTLQCLNVACSLHTWVSRVFWKPREASQQATFFICSPFKSGQRSFKKTEEKKAEPYSTDVISSSSPKPTGKGETWDEGMTEKTTDLSQAFVSYFGFFHDRLFPSIACRVTDPLPSLVCSGLPTFLVSQMRQALPQIEPKRLKSVLLYRASVTSESRKVTAGHCWFHAVTQFTNHIGSHLPVCHNSSSH